MAAIAPDIALLRNELVRKMRAQGLTYEVIGQHLGVTRQNAYRLVAEYNLDGRGTKRVLTADEVRLMKLAQEWGVAPPVPIHHGGTR